MRWPTPSDYQDAVQNPAHCFADPRLRAARPALGPLGLPKVASGNYCSVYQLRSGTSRWAVRCFNRQVPDAERRYHTIDQHLERHRHLPWFVGFDFIHDGIRIRGHWYPIVTMDWVEGDTLSRYLEENVTNSARLRALADQWPRLIADLRAADIAHGDLQHGNILIAGEQLRLVDYDNLWVPQFRGEPSPELGRLHYQHPRRTADDFNLDIGNFSALVVYLSLRALAADPALWRFYNGENLVLTADDYKRPAASAALIRMRNSSDLLVPRLAAELARCAALPVAQVPPLETLLANLGAAAPAGATPPPSAPRGAGRSVSGAPGWLDPSSPAAPPSPPSPPRPAPRAPRPASSPPGDPWWDEQPPSAASAPPATSAAAPAAPSRTSSRRSTARPASRAAHSAQRTAHSAPARPAVSPAGCVGSLLRTCMLVVVLALLTLASAGYWLYHNWESIDPFVLLPPITAPQGGGAGARGDGETGGQRDGGRLPSPPGPPGRVPTSRPGRERAPTPAPSPARALVLLDDAIGQLQEGQAAEALDTLARARATGLPLDERETARRFFSALAEARYGAGQYAESLPAFTRALALDPDNDTLRRLYADARERAR